MVATTASKTQNATSLHTTSYLLRAMESDTVAPICWDQHQGGYNVIWQSFQCFYSYSLFSECLQSSEQWQNDSSTSNAQSLQ